MSFLTDFEQDYFHWLCEMVGVDRGDRSWRILAKTLHEIEFFSLVDHDDNRGYDGMELREEYLRMTNYPKYVTLDGACSVLEMMVALARRMSFETCDPYHSVDDDVNADKWFWELMDNLGLSEFDDEHFYELGGEWKVERIIDELLNRRYFSNGVGGLFPLKQPREDQRDVEIWYQMCAYLTEKECV